MAKARDKTPEQIAKEIRELQESNVRSATEEINKILERRGLQLHAVTNLVIGPGGRIDDKSYVALLPRPAEPPAEDKGEKPGG